MGGSPADSAVSLFFGGLLGLFRDFSKTFAILLTSSKRRFGVLWGACGITFFRGAALLGACWSGLRGFIGVGLPAEHARARALGQSFHKAFPVRGNVSCVADG